MTTQVFFETLEKQYKKKLPFVVYSRPINSIIKCWLQEDNTLYTTNDFSQSGFVFAPFDFSNPSILLPQNACAFQSLENPEIAEVSESDVLNIGNYGKEEHLSLVQNGIKSIKSGHLDKVVLSRVASADVKNSEPLEVFRRLYSTYKNAMVYCWYHPKVGLWLGATPELLFKVEGHLSTMISLAGTQPFNDSETVSWTKKEYDEQQIVTDYIVNQIEPFASKIEVSEVDTVKAGNLLHLKSYIVSSIKDKGQLKEIIKSLHPTPAVCGFPKQKAKDFILENENYDRAYYTGFLGELNLKQTKLRNNNRRNIENSAYSAVKTYSNFYVNLRCAQIINKKALVYVGGGITRDSDPEKEWNETVNKTKTIVKVLN